MKTELSFEEDLACFPASQYSDINPTHTDDEQRVAQGRIDVERLGVVESESHNDIVHLSQDEQMNTTFAHPHDQAQLDEEGIKNLFMKNQFDLGFRQVRRLFQERENALRESAQMRHKLLKLESSERVLCS